MDNVISQFFVLTLRGDTIIRRDYRGDGFKDAPEVFFRHVSKEADVPPIFCDSTGLSFVFVRATGLLVVATTLSNLAPSFALEFLHRFTKICTDYFGTFDEDTLRRNFVIVYELLDEVLDFGFVQTTNTEILKMYIASEPVTAEEGVLDSVTNTLQSVVNTTFKMAPSSSALKGISLDYSSRSGNDEIFVDLIERLTVLLSAQGAVLRASIDGQIVMKSFMKTSPEWLLQLNPDLVVGKGTRYGRITVDDLAFNEVVRPYRWEQDRSIKFVAPDGEFSLLHYRIGELARIPLRIVPSIEIISPHRAELFIKVRFDADEKQLANAVSLHCPVPKSTSSITFANELHGFHGEFLRGDSVVVFTLKKMTGGTEHTARASLAFATPAHPKKETGPISVQFELPMYTASSMEIRAFRLVDDSLKPPYRWVRQMSVADSYVCRITSSDSTFSAPVGPSDAAVAVPSSAAAAARSIFF